MQLCSLSLLKKQTLDHEVNTEARKKSGFTLAVSEDL